MGYTSRMHSSFVHLRAHTTYSLLEGALHIKELVKLASGHAMPALAITDHGNLFGSLEFSLACMEAGVQPVIGMVLFLKPDDQEHRGALQHLNQAEQLPVLAQNEAGYRNLLALSSMGHLAPADGLPALLDYASLVAHSEGLIALSGGPYGKIGKLIANGRIAQGEEATQKLAALFEGRFYLELMRHGLPAEKRIEPTLLDFADRFNLPLVATNDVYFSGEGMYEAHDALLCIQSGRYISERERRRLTPEHRFKTPDEMENLFADIPEAIANTLIIAQRCAVMAPARKPILPSFEMRDAEGNLLSEADALRNLARAGLERRLENLVYTETMDDSAKQAIAAPYRERLEFELDVIIGMNFPGYFLIVSDFITWSKRNDIPVGPGRGSGAGSVVAWALLITDLDPLRYGLLFERFLNPERVSMPDFDVDFCQDRRDEVIRYVQEKYGRDRVAQIITFGKLQARAVLRDVGRVLQMPYGQVDRICKLVPNNPAHPVTLPEAIRMEPMLRAAIEEDESVASLVDIGKKLEGLNRHASTHAAGVVIGDRPLVELVPMYRDPKSDMPVVQYSMKYAESAGLVKFDFLGLKTLTVLQRTLQLLAKRGIHLDLLKLPEGDKKTYDLLSQGEAVGVFQLESAGMRDTLRRLRPDRLEDIIALVSLYRPGPMDNIPTYCARKHGEEKPEYLHPAIEEVLKETFGVIIYQEQVMEIAQKLAGYSLGEADLLRRAMGKKIRSEMEAQRDIFVNRAIARGVPDWQSKNIFDLIAKFAEYGFNKSHAAAYALISYQTAYLKANYPVEFLAASMTYDMHNTDKLAIFRQEAERFGITLLPPDINRSGVLFEVEYENKPSPSGRGLGEGETPTSADSSPAPHPDPLPEGEGKTEGEGKIRYALAAIRNVGAQAMQAVIDERNANGPFTDMFDLANRVDAKVMNRRQFEHLIMAGAFDAVEPCRKRIYDSVEMLMAISNAQTRDRETSQTSLFGDSAMLAPARHLQLNACDEWPLIDKLQNEFNAIGFYLSAHPMEGYRRTLERQRVLFASQVSDKLSGQYTQVKMAGIVMAKKLKTSDRGRFAFLTLSDPTGVYEVSIFDEKLLNEKRELLENGTLVFLQGEGKQDENGARIIAQRLTKLDEELQNAPGGTRLKITIENEIAIEPLQRLLGQPNGKGMRVTLNLPVEGRRAEIELPGLYPLTPFQFSEIGSLQGIAGVEEG